MVALGTIVNTHGIRGEVRLLPYNPSTTVVHPGLRVTLRRDRAEHEVVIAAARRHKQFILLTVDGVASVTAAEGLVGSEVCVPAQTLPSLARDEVYHFQLIGLEVVTTGGTRVGTIREMFTTGANDVCVVERDTEEARGAQQREVMIPFIADIVKDVDLAGRRVVIEPLPGLLE
jgi:16S rRNA processing protein RimM